jgi:hypothetical protein
MMQAAACPLSWIVGTMIRARMQVMPDVRMKNIN